MDLKHRQPSCYECEVKDCSLLKYCSPQWLSVINENKIFLRAREGQQIILEGTPATGVYFVYSGKVKIHKNGPNGKNFILKLGKAGDMLGHCGLGRKYMYPSSVTVLKDSNCCFIENNIFNDLLKENPKLIYELVLYYADELHLYETRMLRLVQMSVREKVADAILVLRDMFGENFADRSVEMFLSRQELADLTGTTKEQVSKILSEFHTDKIIQLHGKRINILKPDKLLFLAGG